MPLIRSFLVRAATLLSAALLPVAVQAHHSFAPHFDIKKPVSISGTITAFEARNPHSYLHLRAVDENGRTEEYVCESHGYTQLSRIGITPAVLKVGAEVRIEGSRSRNDNHRCFFTDLTFPDGRVLHVNANPIHPSTQAVRHDISGTWL